MRAFIQVINPHKFQETDLELNSITKKYEITRRYAHALTFRDALAAEHFVPEEVSYEHAMAHHRWFGLKSKEHGRLVAAFNRIDGLANIQHISSNSASLPDGDKACKANHYSSLLKLLSLLKRFSVTPYANCLENVTSHGVFTDLGLH
jgi:hypothetical protein